MKTTLPISIFLYRAIQAQTDLIDYLEEEPLVFDVPFEEPINEATFYLFGMYWMCTGNYKRIDKMPQVALYDDPAEILAASGYEDLPADLLSVPEFVMGEMLAEWYQEKSTNVINAFVDFIDMIEITYPEELEYSELLEVLRSVFVTVALIYNVASEKPLFTQTNAIDRLFEESGLSSFYESKHQKQSRVILRFLKFWEKVDDAESRRKLLAVRSDDARIEKVKSIVTEHSPSIELIKQEAAPYIALLRIGPIDESRYQFSLDDEDNMYFVD